MSGSYYGKPNRTIHISRVRCTGDEVALSDCETTYLTLEEGKIVAEHISAAGVQCGVVMSNDEGSTSAASAININQLQNDSSDVTAGVGVGLGIVIIILMLGLILSTM